ncbi:MAG: sulfite exporter TauE/SafE family protein [Oscillospiraceae bacterium]|nr:sulfite exporter TauE/SafE family protein [Oscillospiraceae bacterium]
MQYFITFLEGVVSFLSPCMLPMLPLYISYFAGNANKRHHVLLRALAFVLGFTVVFTALGLFVGTLGAFLTRYQTVVNVVGGVVVILFGLSYLEVIRLPFFKGMKGGRELGSIFSAFLFGVIYSVSLTPCVGAFLGSALMLASTTGGAVQGALLLLTYSLGLGVPFLLSAVLIDRLNTAFAWIKRHYRVINLISGIFLIVVGVMMALGMMNVVMSIFS